MSISKHSFIIAALTRLYLAKSKKNKFIFKKTEDLDDDNLKKDLKVEESKDENPNFCDIKISTCDSILLYFS